MVVPAVLTGVDGCAHCGRTGSVHLTGSGQLCVPTGAGSPDCHSLVARFNHATPCGIGRKLFPAAGPHDAAVWR